MNKGVFIFFVMLTGGLSAQIPADYYDKAEGLSGEELNDALYQIIKGHTEFPYTSSSTDVWDILKETDKDPSNSANVILLYTGWSVDAAQEYNSGSGWSREHVWSKSRGDFGTATGAGTDVHNLRPADISVNSAKSNRWFEECTEAYEDDGQYTGCFTSSTDWVWEPRDAVKGDVARMIFYMEVRYEGENGEPDLEMIDFLPADDNTNDPVYTMKSTLLLWHHNDPVDDWERNRNDIIYYSYQGNRNPFIDHPEYAEYIWEGASPPLNIEEHNTEKKESESIEVSLYPNPVDNTITVIRSNRDFNKTYTIRDAVGRVVKRGELTALTSKVDVSDLPGGSYTFSVNQLHFSVIVK